MQKLICESLPAVLIVMLKRFSVDKIGQQVYATGFLWPASPLLLLLLLLRLLLQLRYSQH